MLGGYLMNTCVPAVFVVGPDFNWFALDDCMTWNHLGELVNTFGG